MDEPEIDADNEDNKTGQPDEDNTCKQVLVSGHMM